MLGLRARERWSHWSLLPFYEDEATAADVHRMMTRKVWWKVVGYQGYRLVSRRLRSGELGCGAGRIRPVWRLLVVLT